MHCELGALLKLCHLLGSWRAALLSGHTDVCPRTGRTAGWAAETPFEEAGDAAFPEGWSGLLSGSPSYYLENYRLDKKNEKRNHKFTRFEFLSVRFL